MFRTYPGRPARHAFRPQSGFFGIFSANSWVYLGIVINETTFDIYKNGIQISPDFGDETFSGDPSSSSVLRLGYWSEDILGFFKGTIDEVSIYNRALSASEIWQLYVDPYCWMGEPMDAELFYAAPPVGLSIPVAMHHYEALRVC